MVQSCCLVDILEENEEVFQPDLGTLKRYKAKISVDPDARPQFCCARTVAYAI